MIPCDGCGQTPHVSQIALFMHNGIQVRYCPSCADIWRDFDKTCAREEARRQRLFDLWIAEAIDKVPLHITPHDFPTVLTNRDGQPVTL